MNHMKEKDTTLYKLSSNPKLINQQSKDSLTIEIVESKSEDSNIFNNSVFIDFIFPFLASLFILIVVRYFNRKKENEKLEKLKSETKKNKEEIKQMRISFQPIVISSLQTIQNNIFKDKIDSLKGIIKSKHELYNVNQIYHEGWGIIEDVYHYYQNVYLNFNDESIENLKNNSLSNASLFPDAIRTEFQNLVSKIFEIREIQKKAFSTQNQDMPSGVVEKLEIITMLFDELIDMIRQDLHLNNTFVHDFIAKYQKIQ